MAEGTRNRNPVFDPTTIARYYAKGHWDASTVADYIRDNAERDPEGWAFRAPDAHLTWAGYDRLSTRLAGALVRLGVARNELVGTLVSGGSLVHVVYLAAQKAGLVALGMGPRSGDQEIARLLEKTSCHWFLTRSVHRGRKAIELVSAVTERGASVDNHVTVDLDGNGLRLAVAGVERPLPSMAEAEPLLAGRALGPDELFFLNSTSGTTGVSKCVAATMNVRKYFGPLAADAAGLTDGEVFCSVLPSPYGFGLWSAHFVPARYHATTVLCSDFDAAETLRLIETERVTVLAAVTSQFVMMLNSPAFSESDLSSLRVVFTGGERLNSERAEEFERRTGASILQFYGSNESGPISVTRVADTREKRLSTVGHPIPGQHVRLFDAEGADVTGSGGPGQCAAFGPGITPGYYEDPQANATLFRADGWLLTGDLASADTEGYLHLAGRTADLIIRGGQNVSVLEVETEVGAHPRVAQVAAIGVPDPTLGERVCAVISTRDGQDIDLDEVREHLAARGVSKHCWPERIRVLPELPLSAGGKLDKQRLRKQLLP